jgi:hypothetical protein
MLTIGTPLPAWPSVVPAADHDAVGLGQQRLPEQRVGQDQRQAALGQAFQGRRLGERPYSKSRCGR